MITKLGRIMGEDWQAAQDASGELSEEAASRLLAPTAKRKSEEPETPWGSALGYGAGIGAGAGGLAGVVAGRGALGGSALGALLGLVAGAGSKSYDDMQIEDASNYIAENDENRAWRRARIINKLQERQADRIGSSVASNMAPRTERKR